MNFPKSNYGKFVTNSVFFQRSLKQKTENRSHFWKWLEASSSNVFLLLKIVSPKLKATDWLHDKLVHGLQWNTSLSSIAIDNGDDQHIAIVATAES